jgi:hypothetical protein
VDRLTGDPEDTADLFPRPTALSGEADTADLDLLGQPVQRTDRSQADFGVI